MTWYRDEEVNIATERYNDRMTQNHLPRLPDPDLTPPDDEPEGFDDERYEYEEDFYSGFYY